MTCDENGICYIDGWDEAYKMKQNGNTCAVVSIAGALSILYRRLFTQEDIQPFFRCTYWGIGVVPPKQAKKIKNNQSEFHYINAEYSQGSRNDLFRNLLKSIPTVVTFALPIKDGVGHAILLIGYHLFIVDDIEKVEFIFFNPAIGATQTERQIVDMYDEYFSYEIDFDDLWAGGNMFVSSNAMVSFWLEYPDMIPWRGPDWKYKEQR